MHTDSIWNSGNQEAETRHEKREGLVPARDLGSSTSKSTITMTSASTMKAVMTLTALSLALAARAEAPSFTIDGVLRSLAKSYPQASRVDDALPAGVVARENVTYVERESGPLALDVYQPTGSALLPAVLIVHGGGWIAGDRTMERPFAKQLAARGYVAVPVSYRLGRPGRFPAPVHDLKAAVRWLRTHAADYGIDARRIAIVGGSAGGTLATMIGVTNGQRDTDAADAPVEPSSDVQAVVDIDGTVTFLDNRLIEQAETQPSPYWEYVHGIYSENRATWVAASPLGYVTRRSAPTLFIKSTAKQPILAGREEMAARLRILGVTAEEILIPDTPHPFWLVHPWFEQVVAETDRFLREQLK
jgi:pectinesterase